MTPPTILRIFPSSLKRKTDTSFKLLMRFLMMLIAMLLIQFTGAGQDIHPDARHTIQVSPDNPLKFYNAHRFLLQGRGATIPEEGYNRIDSNMLGKVTKSVARLSKNTAGLQVDFITDSKTVAFKWSLSDYGVLPNMTPIAKNGLDLYALNDGKWQYVAAVAATGPTTEKTAIRHLDGTIHHFRVYLPLYSSLTDLSIGVDSNSSIQAPEAQKKPAIVIYGTSITQGASASRPGLAYPNILSRDLNATVYNMGFSGSGKMEPVMADIIAQMPADLYVIDCTPNMTAGLIRQRALPFLHHLRRLRPTTPILLMESPIRETSFWNLDVQKSVTEQNKAINQVFKTLLQEGMTHLYYLAAKDLTGQDHEATIDGTHLTDVGFQRLLALLEPVIKSILPGWQ